MEHSIIAELASQFGAPGLIIGYLVWDRLQMRADRKEADATKAIYDNARLEADKSLAASLAALTTVIQSKVHS